MKDKQHQDTKKNVFLSFEIISNRCLVTDRRLPHILINLSLCYLSLLMIRNDKKEKSLLHAASFYDFPSIFLFWHKTWSSWINWAAFRSTSWKIILEWGNTFFLLHNFSFFLQDASGTIHGETNKQCFGSGSRLDPDSGVLWIRIRIRNPDPGA